MRYYELTEKTEIHIDAMHIMQTISKNCKPFLKLIGSQVTTYPLYRGMEAASHPESITKKQVRLDNRRPMSSAQIKHDRYNLYFQEVFGAPFRNALFASGDRKMAQFYGYPFVVFPIGEFEFIWSPDVNDMALDIQWPQAGGWINVPPSQEAVDDKLEFAGYRDRDLPQAIKSGNEIMIRCKEYYAVRTAVFQEINF